MKIKGLYLRHLFHHSYIRSLGGSVSISPKAHLRDVKAYIYNGGSLTIGENCRIENCIISISGGKVELSENSIVIGKSHEPVQINVEDGKISISHHVKVCCKRVWVRFGGELSIGEYTNINDGSEIRCDERVTIGAFNQISYNVRIWDTNTHSIFSMQKRREITIEKFPYFGYESSRPKTAPVEIGDDCWIGEQSAILKGSIVGNRSIIGFRSLIAGDKIPADSKVITDVTLRII